MKKTVIAIAVIVLALTSMSGANNRPNGIGWLELEKKYYSVAGDVDYDKMRVELSEALDNLNEPYHPVWTKMRLYFIKFLIDEYKKQDILSKDIRIKTR